MKAVYIENNHEEKLHTEDDLCLFRAPRRMPEGHKCPTGKDLFVHKTRAGKEVFYLINWFMKPSKREEIVQITPRMAERFLEERGIFCNTTSPEDQKASQTMLQYGWGMLEEF